MFSDAINLVLMLLALAAWGWALSRTDPLVQPVRRWVCSMVIVTNGCYLAWRTAFTLPQTIEPVTLLAWWFWLIESLALVETTLFWICMSRTTQARHTRPPSLTPPSPAPRVEIWIPTYNEPLEVLEKSILAAGAVDYPHRVVRVLDDGRRDWLQGQCRAWGVDYVTRPDRLHAKAGNLNHALSQSQADFVVIMDADFAAHRDFVRRVLPYFSDERLAVVQTPQTFYNTDLAQQNLGVGSGISDEQAFFYRDIQPSRDAWGGTMFCGSCAMLRVRALRDIGGFPTRSLTEDLLATLRLLGRRWKVRYLNQPLATGLAAESVQAFFVQRDRWCRGSIETLFDSDGPLRNPGLSPMQRILFIPVYWLVTPLYYLSLIVVPTLCLLTDLNAVHIDNPADIAFTIVPTLAINLIGMTWISRGHFMPGLSTALSMATAPRLAGSALSGLLRPGRVPFKVTPKGLHGPAGLDSPTFWFFVVMSAATLAGIILAGWVGEQPVERQVGFPWMVFTATINLLHFMVVLVLVRDRQRRRREERFRIHRPMRLIDEAGRPVDGFVVDMSVSGLRLRMPGRPQADTRWHLCLDSLRLPFCLKGWRDGQGDGNSVDWVAQFGEMDPAQRAALVRFLFSGRHPPVVRARPFLGRALSRVAKVALLER